MLATIEPSFENTYYQKRDGFVLRFVRGRNSPMLWAIRHRILRIMIPTGQLLADIAQSLGYELVSIDLFRTRLSTATKEQLREEVVVLRWPWRYP